MASTPKPKSKAFWTIRSVAEHLDVPERTVHRWIDSGDIVAHRFGRSVRISDNDLRAFLAQHRGFYRMSFPVIASHYMTTTYYVFGNTLSIQTFHLLYASILDMIFMST